MYCGPKIVMDTERWENSTVASLLYKQSHDRWAGVTPRFLKGTHAIRQSAIVRVVTLCHLHVNQLSVKCSKWSFHWFIKGPVYFMAASLIPGLTAVRPSKTTWLWLGPGAQCEHLAACRHSPGRRSVREAWLTFVARWKHLNCWKRRSFNPHTKFLSLLLLLLLFIIIIIIIILAMSGIERFEGLLTTTDWLSNQSSRTTGWQVCDLPVKRTQRKGGDSIDDSNQYSLGLIFRRNHSARCVSQQTLSMVLCRDGKRLAWAFQAVAAFLSVPPCGEAARAGQWQMAAFVKETWSPVRTAGLWRCPEGGMPENEIKTLLVLDGEGEWRSDKQPLVMLRNDDDDIVMSVRSLLGLLDN